MILQLFVIAAEVLVQGVVTTSNTGECIIMTMLSLITVK